MHTRYLPNTDHRNEYYVSRYAVRRVKKIEERNEKGRKCNLENYQITATLSKRIQIPFSTVILPGNILLYDLLLHESVHVRLLMFSYLV